MFFGKIWNLEDGVLQLLIGLYLYYVCICIRALTLRLEISREVSELYMVYYMHPQGQLDENNGEYYANFTL